MNSRRGVGSALRVARAHSSRSFSSLTPAQHPTQVTELPNKLRVASENTGGETATVGVWIDTGSRYESDENNGVAHFLEHMAFKGTAKRTQLQLEMEVENMGGHLNAYTSREQTVYYAKVLKKDVPRAVEMVSDILLNSQFDSRAVDRERDVILREMEEVESQTEEVIFDRLHEVAYVGTPLARTILGPVENIKSISSDDIVRYIKTHYTAPRMVVAAAGAVDHDQFVQMTGDYFGGVAEHPPAGYEYDCFPSLFTGADVRDYRDDMPTAHFAFAFEGLKWTDPDVFTLMLCQSLLGVWDQKVTGSAHVASPMVRSLAEFPHLATSVQPFCTCYNDTGLFGLYVQAELTDHHNSGQLLQVLQDEMVSLCTGVTDEDVARGKAQLKFNLMQQMDGTSPNAEEIGRQLLTYGRRMSLAETFARVDEIEAADVKRVSNKVIWDQEIALAGMGNNLKTLGDMNHLRRQSYWHVY